ncbi:MAG TPA: sugar phosphate isomerase/epimerase [Vicinamibacterales bacterium]|nr:sugar phosphate isomerase/epimerase [Vicinamibacterales bacterium]
MTITRRDWLWGVGSGMALVAVLPIDAAMRGQTSGARSRGVTLGVQSYSFRDRATDAAIAAMQQLGLTSCELWQGHVEPRGTSRDDLRRWRETVPLDEFRALKEKFHRAKVQVAAYNISFRDDYSDAEIARGFEMTRALGADVITASASTGVVTRVASVAAQHKIRVGMHNHSRIDPNEFATPESFVFAMKASPFIAVNLDIGHFTAANFDAVAFLQEHHARIVTLHIKDRKRNDGPNVPFGEGDTPIGAVLRLLRDQAWAIPANIEYEYKGGDTVEEVRRCLEFCRRELES